MSATDVIVIVALAFAIWEEFNAKGRSLLGWSIILICIALLWGPVTSIFE